VTLKHHFVAMFVSSSSLFSFLTFSQSQRP
jgi:hypothetical protein